MFDAESAAPAQPSFAPDASATAVQQPAYPFRLLPDENVLAMYPISNKRGPLGRLASYLFVTDSRVIYSAEAKTVLSSSTHSREFAVETVKGFDIGRDRGLDALGLALVAGSALNFLITIGFALFLGAAGSGSSSSYYGSSGFDATLGGAGWFFGLLAFGSLVLGAVTFMIMRRPKASLSIVGPGETRPIAQELDVPKLVITVLIFLVFGLFSILAVLAWTIFRELGMLTAGDAQQYADAGNIDRISFEAGALILDVQARGKLAGQA